MLRENRHHTSIAYAILAALCYGVSVPFSKVLQAHIGALHLAAYLYIGAGLGMAAIHIGQRKQKQEASLSRDDLPYVVAMVLLDIAAPILLMLGLKASSSATVSLLGNFEIVVTSLVAFAFFKENIGKRMGGAIALITLSSMLLSLEEIGQLRFSSGALLVLLACACWGVENNCTSRLSLRNPVQIVLIKGVGSGVGAWLIAALFERQTASLPWVLLSLLLGFCAYGLSIYFYILAQRHIGAARTGVYYAFAPFIGVLLSLLLLGERPSALFFIAFLVMACGAFFAASERHSHPHVHEPMAHAHRHRHDDGHHTHVHVPAVVGEHSHPHAHARIEHTHRHAPDIHHAHTHEQ